MKIQHNPPAFPITQDNSGETWNGEGLTMRDYFAAKALPAIINGSFPDLDINPKQGESIAQCHARASYEFADAMLEARK